MRNRYNRIIVVAGGFLSSEVVLTSAKERGHVEGDRGRLRTRRRIVHENPKSANKPNGIGNGVDNGIMNEEDIEFLTRLLANGSLPIPIVPPTPTPVEAPNTVAAATYSPSISSPGPTTYAPTVDATTLSPTSSCRLTPSERRSQIIEKLGEISQPDQLNLANTPQRNAFDWIVDDDGSQICPDDATLLQRYVLAVFYFSTNGNGWYTCSAPGGFDQASIDLANASCNLTTPNATVLFPNDIRGTDAWLTPDSECLWGGVSCYGSDSGSNAFNVNVIEFESNGLSGTLPTEMEALTSIRFLALERGSISGTIPSSFGNLKSLLLLDLDYNYITGTLPDSLWTLEALRQLDLNDNNLEGTLSNDIGLLRELRFFQIDNNYMTGTIPSSMGGIPNFSLIGLSGNEFTGAIAGEVCNLRPSPLQTLVVDCGIECEIPECCTSCVPPTPDTTTPATTTQETRPPVPTPPKFNCPSATIVGCTAPDPSDPQDECLATGELCNNGNPGEFCCMDGCPRKYCTAKEAE